MQTRGGEVGQKSENLADVISPWPLCIPKKYLWKLFLLEMSTKFLFDLASAIILKFGENCHITVIQKHIFWREANEGAPWVKIMPCSRDTAVYAFLPNKPLMRRGYKCQLQRTSKGANEQAMRERTFSA